MIDIDTAMGDGTQLGHASSLHSGADRARRPALAREPRATDPQDIFLTVDPAPCSTFRGSPTRPISCCPCCWCGCRWDRRCHLAIAQSPEAEPADGRRDHCLHQLDLLPRRLGRVSGAIPRLTACRLRHRDDRSTAAQPPHRSAVYRLYGFYYGLHRLIACLTNAKALSGLVGDTSWIVHYLRGIGTTSEDRSDWGELRRHGEA